MIFLFLLVVGGVGIYVAIKLGKAAARKARTVSTKLVTQVNAMGTGEAAETERLRVSLRREVSTTRQAVDHALRQGWGLGDLPALIKEIEEHAAVLDSQLGMYAQHRRASGFIDHVTLERLRDHYAKLTTTCARVRADLLDSQVGHAATGLSDLHDRTELELEARRGSAVRDPLDEIDELYRRTVEQPHPVQQPHQQPHPLQQPHQYRQPHPPEDRA
ncbi:hypothetical protein [Microtetraspora sp. NBRC 13810]|uniref:hypothetical protein n=1 Tax=Microtetraspora sp. NBRC 13810 TaxID=3030990 RepID=UPI002553A25E|nr:hypothetical protein [Microtetraspora sp. NBRC 13810]